MGKLGMCFVAFLPDAGAAARLAGTAVVLAGTLGLLGTGTAQAAQRLPTPEWAPPVVPWLMSVQPDAAGSGRSVISLRIVRRHVKPPVRDNPTMRIQQQLAPPDLSDGHTGGRVTSAHGPRSAALR
jgi:hypothetical protein